MTIMFDVDGVLADFIRGFMDLAKGMYDRPYLTPLEVYGTAEQEQWDGFRGLDRRQVSLVWDEIKKSSVFWATLPLLCSNDELFLIRRVHRVDEIYFVTNRPGHSAKSQTESWLRDRGFHNPTVIMSGMKGEVAKAVNAKYLIDDKAGNAVFAQYYSPGTACYILDRKYNQFDPKIIGSKVGRVKTVGEFMDIVEKRA